MSLRSPRRIFRRSSVRRAVWVIPAASCAAGILGLAVVLVSEGAARGPATQPLPGDVTLLAEPAQVEVVDGDTLRVRDTVIRLRGVSAPERGAGCGPRPRGDVDCGRAATVILAGLVSHAPVECRLGGRDGDGHVLGLCRSGGVEINSAVVESGWAVASPDQPSLDAAERSARAHRRGLWAPWADPAPDRG